MESCSPKKIPIVRGDVFSKSQYPQSDNERIQMQAVSYESVVGSCDVCSSVYTT
jgi:hypothetical protein